jgi:hypothetical protein
MAVNDILIRRGTAFTLASSAASGVMNFACGSGSGVQSATFDLGDPHADSYEMFVDICAAAAPTAGTTFDFYLAGADSAGHFPGKATGVSGAYLTGATIGESLVQLSYLGSVVAINASGVQSQSMVVYPTMRSGTMIMKNSTNIASIDASGLVQLIPLIPIYQTG